MNKEKELNLRYLQLFLTIVYMGSLCITIILTYNEINKLKNKPYFNQRTTEIINRIAQLIIFALLLYITSESNPPNYNMKMLASIASIISASLLLYTTIIEKDNSPARKWVIEKNSQFIFIEIKK